MATRMTLDLAAGAGAINVPNIRGIGAELASVPDEEGQQVDLWIDFYGAGAKLFSRQRATITNTSSDRFTKTASPVGYDDIITKDKLATPTGFTDVMNGWRGGAGKNARQKGLVDALLALGVLGTGLTGPTS